MATFCWRHDRNDWLLFADKIMITNLLTQKGDKIMCTKLANRTTIVAAISILVLLILLSVSTLVRPANTSNQALAAQIDQLLADTFKPGEPGAAVIVVRNGQVIMRKGYGMANLELGVPVAPEMVFRLGSITKQFTAVAILMLVEDGRVSLNDDITCTYRTTLRTANRSRSRSCSPTRRVSRITPRCRSCRVCGAKT